MPDIKTRDVVKGTVKTIDKSAVAAERMKDAYIRTKDKAEHGIYSADNSPNEYAADRITGSAESAAREAVHQFDKQGRRGIRTTKENISKAKEHIRQKKAENGLRRSADTAKKSIRTLERSGKNIKQTAKSTGKVTIKSAKGSVKTAQKTIKTAEQTAKTAIKTTQQAAKVAQKTAQATARAARAAAHAARAAAKAAIVTAKAVAKAIALAVKAIIAGTKALIAAIAAGGWIAVAVILVICMAAFLVGSCFGIFFGSPDSEAQSIRQVVAGLDADYMGQLERIKANISHDVLEMSGSRAG